MNASQEHIIDALGARGYRVTAPRLEVAAILAKGAALSIAEIAERSEADETSVYRTVSLFEELGLVERIQVGTGTDRFALAHGHHHHLVCTDCNRIVHVPCCDLPTPRLSPHGFAAIDSHEVTYYGRCQACA